MNTFLSNRARMLALSVAAFVAALVAVLFFWGSPEPAIVAAEPAPASEGVTLTPLQVATAGIVVEPIAERPLARVFRAPGEVKANDYTTHLVASRIGATVVKRHAQLGDRVRKGQVLVTLFSAEMAEAQSTYYLAERDYSRFSRLGTRSIAAMQIEQAAAKRHEARGRLESFGLSQAEIAALASRGLVPGRTGQFELRAERDGKITLDDFRDGQVVEAGKTLYEISDPGVVWVEAQVSPNHAAAIVGQSAKVFDRTHVHEARVVQVGDRIDEATRTIPVRLQLSNPNEELKPGEFVDVELYGAAQPVLAVPTAAVMVRAGGERVVYVETARGAFEPHAVRALYAVDGHTAITGVAAGTRIVTAGAFFVMSEAAKSEFGEDE